MPENPSAQHLDPIPLNPFSLKLRDWYLFALRMDRADAIGF